MFPITHRRRRLGWLLALVSLGLIACASSTRSTAQAPAPPPADATGLVTPATPGAPSSGAQLRPEPIGSDPAASPVVPPTFQGTECGYVRMIADGLVDDPGNAAALDCFWQAYQQPAMAGQVQMVVKQRFFETTKDRSFRLDGTSGSTILTEEVRFFGLFANDPEITTYTCTGLVRDNAGMHFLGCGSDGDFTVPATPIGVAP